MAFEALMGSLHELVTNQFTELLFLHLKDILTQLGLAFFGLLSAYLVFVSTNKKHILISPLVGLIGQPFWLYAAYSNSLPGMFVVAMTFSYFYSKSCWRQRKELFGLIKQSFGFDK